jgi:hypothetical protein
LPVNNLRNRHFLASCSPFPSGKGARGLG